jgi:hypothetical protein
VKPTPVVPKPVEALFELAMYVTPKKRRDKSQVTPPRPLTARSPTALTAPTRGLALVSAGAFFKKFLRRVRSPRQSAVTCAAWVELGRDHPLVQMAAAAALFLAAGPCSFAKLAGWAPIGDGGGCWCHGVVVRSEANDLAGGGKTTRSFFYKT